MKIKFEVELNKLNDNELSYCKLLDMAITSINMIKQYNINTNETEQLESFVYDIIDNDEQNTSTYILSMDLGESAIDNKDIEEMLYKFLGGSV